MDLKAVAGSGEAWTEERHLSFLNMIEASFVRTMLGFDGGSGPTRPRLDRYLPDSATESTRDLQGSGRAAAVVAAMDSGNQNRGTRTYTGATKRRFYSNNESSQDQVVPEFERLKAGKANAHKDKKGCCNQVSRWL